MRTTRITGAAVGVVALSTLLAACSSSSSSPASSGSSSPASAAAGSAAASAGSSAAPTGDPITIGMPIAQSGAAGIADHKDCWNGAQLAQEQLNAAGGVNGRPVELDVTDIDILSPEGITSSFQKLTSDGVQAIVSPFVLIPPPAMDAAAAYGAPYLSGDTNIDAQKIREADPAKYGNYFVDPAETYYGSGLVPFLDGLASSGSWTPKNNTILVNRLSGDGLVLAA